jgi:thiol:disulfide interchange protein DsbD
MMRSLVRTLSTMLWLMVLALSPAHAQGLAKFGIGTGAGNVAGSGQVGAVVVTPQVRAELLAHAPQGIAPGQPLQLGLQITHQPEWHTYWKNPGDSGLPTTLDWTLPAGLKAGEIVWPTPKKIPIGTLANYGYEGTVLLPVPVTIGADFKPASERIDIALRAAWLVCRKECIPEEGEFRITLPVRGSTAVHGAAFDASARATPRNLPGSPSAPDSVRMQGQVRVLDGAIEVQMAQLPVEWRGKALNLFPETPEVIENAATPQQSWSGAVWNARLPLSAQRSNSPPTMAWVVASGAEAWRTELKVVGTWPQAAAPAAATPLPPALDAALKANQAAQEASRSAPSAVPLSLWAALAGALLGGLILNLMPCVFPVLAIKVMGFARHGSDVRAHRASGVAYTAGVVLSFMLLGLLLMALRAAGEAIGWGFQLQSPAVVAALALLFTVIGLNLAGVFEFGSFLPSSVASLQARHPAADAFLSGVLAVAVASPCTAPFMGASLGLAVTLPAWQALAVFAAIGLGMALPYLAASWLPAVARALPRPGAWMDHFRRFMAFPMFGTVVWLLWVLGQQSGIDGAAALLACLVALSMLVWALTLKGRSRVVAGALAALALLGLLLSVGPAVTRMSPDLASAPSSNSATSASGANAAGWQAWVPGRVEQIVAGGQPVFVDFTAAWCVTCQYNKKTTLADPKVLADFAAKRVVLLRADWTRRDPAITAALTQLGRSGVPVYVIYRAGQPPVVLPEILSVDEVRAELAKL